MLEPGSPRPRAPGTRVDLRFTAGRIVALVSGNVLNLDVRIDADRVGTTLGGYPEPQTDQARWLGRFLPRTRPGPWTSAGSR